MGIEKSPPGASGLVRVSSPKTRDMRKAGVLDEGEVPDDLSRADKIQWDSQGEVSEGEVRKRKAAARQRATQFKKGNKAASGRKPAAANLGIPVKYIDAADARYRRFIRNASYYRKARCRELAQVHGFLSAGATNLVASASLSMAVSRYAYTLSMEETDRKEAAKLITLASKLANDAKQLELAAWELASREAEAVKAMKAEDDAPAWLVKAEGESGE